MAKISTYPQPTPPQLGDYVIGTDISDLLMTKNYLLSDIITLATTTNQFVTIVGAQTITGSKTFDYGTSTGVPASVIINLPAQTQPAYSPDALLISINGQTPSTIPGFIGGVVVQASLLDNVCYSATLNGNAGSSIGIVAESKDAHSGNYLEFRKNLLSVPTTIFSVANNGDTKANTLSVYDYPNGDYCKIAINDSYFTISRTNGGFTPMLSTENGDNLILTNGNGAAAQIINNLSVSRNYTLPNASGTFALTSDLTNLVTTNTVQTITASKTFNGGLIFDAEQAAITMHNRYDMGQNIRITLYNTATDPEGLRVDNNNDNGTAIGISNNASGYGFYGDNSSTGVLMTLVSSASSTGDLLRCFKNSAITTKVDANGNITAPSLTTTGKVLIGTTQGGAPTFGSNPNLVVTSPFPAVGGVIDLRNLSANIVANDLLGKIQFTGKDDDTVGYTSSTIEGIVSGSAGSGNPGGGVLIFKTAADSTGASPIEKMRITQNGAIQPGTDNTYSLGASGIRWSSVWAANGTIQTSDEREKKDIVDSDLGLDFVSKLRPVSFKWKVGKNEVTSELDGLDEEGNPKTKIVVTPIEGKRTHYGLIAQEVEALLDGKDFGGFIHDAETDIKGLRYDQFIPVLINAIKELRAEIEILKAK